MEALYLKIPEDLKIAIQHRAIDEKRKTVAELVIQALQEYLINHPL